MHSNVNLRLKSNLYFCFFINNSKNTHSRQTYEINHQRGSYYIHRKTTNTNKKEV